MRTSHLVPGLLSVILQGECRAPVSCTTAQPRFQRQAPTTASSGDRSQPANQTTAARRPVKRVKASESCSMYTSVGCCGWADKADENARQRFCPQPTAPLDARYGSKMSHPQSSKHCTPLHLGSSAERSPATPSNATLDTNLCQHCNWTGAHCPRLQIQETDRDKQELKAWEAAKTKHPTPDAKTWKPNLLWLPFTNSPSLKARRETCPALAHLSSVSSMVSGACGNTYAFCAYMCSSAFYSAGRGTCSLRVSPSVGNVPWQRSQTFQNLDGGSERVAQQKTHQ